MRNMLHRLKWLTCILFIAVQWTILTANPNGTPNLGAAKGELVACPSFTGPAISCVNQLETYLTTPVSGLSYAWSVSSGGILTNTTGPSTLVNWTAAGAQFVVLTTTGPGAAVSSCTLSVVVSPRPTPSILTDFISDCPEKGRLESANAIGQNKKDEECWVVCENSVVNYWTNPVAGNTYSWIIVGGTPATATGSSVSVTWGASGTGVVILTETAPGGCSETVEKCIKIVDAPVANFLFNGQDPSSPLKICLGETVYFSDLSTGGAYWLWTFGDGGTSTLQNPAHTYNSPGTFVGTLTVKNECGCTSIVRFTVIVRDEVSPEIGCISTVCLKDCSFYSVSNLSNCPSAVVTWSIQGGKIINNPTAGTVNVIWDDSDGFIQANGYGLICASVMGCPDLCDGEVCVRVPVIHPVTIVGDQVACVGDPVTYSVPVQPGINEPGFPQNGVDFDWIVSAGGTIISVPPYSNSITVIWNSPGTGTVDLDVYENYLTNENCKFDPEEISIDIKPSFTISPDNATICVGGSQTFFPSVSDVFNWTMTGPGGTVTASAASSFLAAPTVPGTYVISASSTSGMYCDVTPTAVLRVLPAPPVPTGTLNGTLSVCANTPYTYTLSNAPPPGTVLIWSVTGGTLYGGAGQTVTTQWSGGAGMTLSVRSMSTIAPFCTSAPLTFNVTNYTPPTTFVSGNATACVNEVHTYTTTSSTLANYTNLVWSVSPAFGGSVVSGQGTPTVNVLFNTSAPATVQIICTATVCGSPISSSKTVTVTQIPTYTINANPSPACLGEAVGLSLASTAGVSTYNWNFGDATPNSPLSAPTHIWNSTGSFPVTTQLTLNICGGPTVTAATTINILPLPVVNVTATNGYVLCNSITSTTLVASTQFASTYLWSTGATTSSITVSASGIYTVVATSVATGCSVSYPVRVYSCGPVPICTSATPPWTFIATENCDSYTFTPNTTAATFYAWNFGDLTGNTTAGSSPVSRTYAHPGYYQVYLSSIDPINQCTMTVVQTITMKFKGKFSYTFNCASGTMQTELTDRSEYLAVPGVTFATPEWYEGTTLLGSGSVLSTPLTPGSHTVYLKMTYGSQVCYSPPQTIIVPGLPAAAFTFNSPVCEGVPIVFNNTSTGSYFGSSWVFDPGAATPATSGLPSPTRVYEAPPTSYTPVLTISSVWGCTSTAVNTVTVNNSGPTPTITTSPVSPQCQGTPINLTAVPTALPGPIGYLWYNSVAPAAPVGTANVYTPSLSGTYGVKVSDGNGCSYNVLANPIVYLPPPVVQIVGKAEYCLDETVELTADLGSAGSYNYSWSVSPSVPFTASGANVSMPANVAGAYTFNLTITHIASGCSNSGSMTIVVHPGVTGLSITSSANCEPATLTAFGTGAVAYNWSTGDNTAVTTVNQGGFYSVIATDTWGCTAKETITIDGKPDLSNVMVGCYEFCEPVVWQAPACSGCTYQWFLNGSALAGETNATINISTSGAYTVEVSNGPGCTTQSDPIDISISTNPEACHECKVEFREVNFECVGIDPITGNLIYEFTVNVVNYGGALFGLSGISSWGPITIDSPIGGFIPGGGATTAIHGYLTWNSQKRDGCFSFLGFLSADCESQEKCKFEWCGELPKCCDKPCALKVDNITSECIGFGYYKVTFSTYNDGCLLVNAYIKASSGIYAVVPGTIPVGVSTHTVVILGNPGSNTLVLCGYRFNGERCCTEFKVDLKECDPKNCRLEAGRITVNCIGQSAAGFDIFHFRVEVYGAPAGASFVVVPSFGFITGLTWTCSGGVCVVEGDYENTYNSGYACFNVLAIGTGTPAEVCYGYGCVDIPRCRESKGTERTEQMNKPAVATGFSLVPNPATNQVTINVENAAIGVYSIVVTDMIGQNRMMVYPTGNDLSLDISKLTNGIYNVVVTDKNGLSSIKKLVVVQR